MRKRLLSALLAMAMMLTMLPTAAFAAGEGDEKVAPEVEAYGFVWEAQQPAADLGNGYTAGSDWMGETMWVALKDGSTAGQNLWFEVTVDTDVWGCAATTSEKNMFAFSFLNRTTQWEQAPQNITVGEGQAHAEKYLADKNVAKATLKVYVTESPFTSENHTLPQDATPIFEEEVAITKNQNTLEVVTPDEPEEPAADSIFVAASDGTFAGKKAADLQTGAIAFKAGTGENANKYAVTGVTLKKIEGWTDFNQALEEEQSGYYLAFAVSKTMGGNTVTGMVLTGKDAQGKPTDKTYEGEALNSAFSDNDNKQCDLFIHLGADADAVKAKAPVIKLKYGNDQGYTEYTLDLSAVKVEGEVDEYNITVAEAQNGTAKVQVGGKDVTAAAANDEVTVVAAPATGFEVDTITVMQGETKVTVTEGKFTMPAGDVTVTVTFKKTAEEPAERTEKIASTGFEAKGADADKALGITNEDGAAAHCDPNTMWAKFEGLNAEKNYTLTVKKGDAEVYTETPFSGTATKVYFTLDPELVAKANANADDPAVKNHSVAKTAIAEGKYEFTLTEVKAQAPAGQAGETEEKPLEAKAELEIRKVRFNTNGATSGVAPEAIFAALNGAIALPVQGELTKTGYTFQGWGVALNEAGKYVVTDTIELKAQWQNDNVTHAKAEVNTGELDEEVANEVKKTTVDSSAMLQDPEVLKATDELAKQIPADVTGILTEEQKDEGGYTVKVAVYMEVAAQEYTPAAEGVAPVLKLEITPMSKLVAVKDDEIKPVEKGKENAQKLSVTEFIKPVTINVALPTGFAEAGAQDVFAKHIGTPVQYIKATVADGVDTLAGSVIATFEANSFSPYELTKDSRKVAVTFKDTEGTIIAEIGEDGVLNLTPVNIGEDLPTATAPEGKEFKGWAVAADKTKVVYNGKLTEDYLTEMSKTATLELFAVISDKSTGGSTGPAPGGMGGSSGSATYSVNVPTAEHGTVTVNPRNAAKDATVTITVAPDKGYHLESLTVTDKDGNKIELTKVDATKYTFKMPASRVEVKAVFAEGEAPAISFTDVAEGEYYYDAVLWAVNKGITNGLTDTTFGPNASCTRAQMVTFLWRAAGSPEPTSTTTAFTDIDSNEYYYKAVLWAVEKGITTGTTETTFSPSATVTRAQTVTFLYRYAGTPAVSGNNNFTDLEAGEYYVDAVQWAATNGITTGTTETTFSPANNCTRGQIVTFLYRHIVK